MNSSGMMPMRSWRKLIYRYIMAVTYLSSQMMLLLIPNIVDCSSIPLARVDLELDRIK
jgi:hypothetical protein